MIQKNCFQEYLFQFKRPQLLKSDSFFKSGIDSLYKLILNIGSKLEEKEWKIIFNIIHSVNE